MQIYIYIYLLFSCTNTNLDKYKIETCWFTWIYLIHPCLKMVNWTDLTARLVHVHLHGCVWTNMFTVSTSLLDDSAARIHCEYGMTVIPHQPNYKWFEQVVYRQLETIWAHTGWCRICIITSSNTHTTYFHLWKISKLKGWSW